MIRVRVRNRMRGTKKTKIRLAQPFVKYQDDEDKVQAEALVEDGEEK